MNVAGNSLAAVPTSVAATSGAIIIVAINTTAPAAQGIHSRFGSCSETGT